MKISYISRLVFSILLLMQVLTSFVSADQTEKSIRNYNTSERLPERFSQLKLYHMTKSHQIKDLQTAYAPNDEIIVSYAGSSLWHGMNDIKDDSSFLYCVMQYGILIFDKTVPNHPEQITFIDLPGGNAWDIEIDSGFAYIADGGGGLVIFNISDPYNPVPAGNFDTPDYAIDISIQDNYAFIADGEGGLQILDITNPYKPVFVGKWDSPSATEVTVAGEYAYLADNQNVVQILNIVNPSTPSLVGAFAVDGYVMDMVVKDSLIYVTSERSGLLIVDISNPEKPNLLASAESSSGAYGLAIHGDFAYVTFGDANGLQIFDISNPNSPSLTGNLNIPGLTLAILLDDDFAYIAEWNSGLKAVDVSSISNPTLAGGFTTSGAIRDIAVKDGYGYAAGSRWQAGNAGMQIVDLSDSSHPAEVTELLLPGPEIADIEIHGNYAYVADLFEGMQIVEISDQSSPTIIGSYPTPDHCLDIEISGSLAFTANDLMGLEILNITNPETPELIGSFPVSGSVTSLAVKDEYLFLYELGQGMIILNISDPENPSQIGNLEFAGIVRDIKIRDDYAFIANETEGLMVVNIFNPDNPVLIDNPAIPEKPVSIHLNGNYAYITDVFYGLRIYNISDPENIYHTGSIASRGLACDVMVDDNHAYLADYDGLIVLNLLRPEITAIPENLNFEAYQDGSSPLSKSLQITNTGAGSLLWTVSNLSQWLSINSYNGTAPSDLTVMINSSGLIEGSYHDTISIAGNAENSPLRVPITLTIKPPNRIPSLEHIKPQVIDEDHLLTGAVKAEDLDGGIPILNIANVPENFTFTNNNDGTGMYSFQPNFFQAGNYMVLFTATDQFDSLLIDSMELDITVNNVNRAPVISTELSDTNIIENDSFGIIIEAYDPDNEPITLQCTNKPSSAIFTDSLNNSGYLFFRPSHIDVDSQYILTFTATDTLGGTSESPFPLNVLNRQLEIIEVEIGPNPWNPGFNEVLVDSNIQIVFNEGLLQESLLSNILLLSALDDELQYQYDPVMFSLFVSSSSEYLIPLDTITIIFSGDIQDLAGYPLGSEHEWIVHTGAVVYPGDTNNDGVVDERDILPIGAYWDVNGVSRRNAPDCLWSMVPAHTWAPLAATYADADGSGLVDSDDICGVADNWGRNIQIGIPEKESRKNIYANLKQFDQNVLLDIYTALSNCNDTQGKSIISGILESMLENQLNILPEKMELSQNYPNPFNPSTLIEYAISTRSHVEISIYALDGRMIKTLVNTINEPGLYSVTWNGTDNSGSPTASGMYFYRMKTDQTTISRKMLLLK
jgi:hypothetical protein